MFSHSLPLPHSIMTWKVGSVGTDERTTDDGNAERKIYTGVAGDASNHGELFGVKVHSLPPPKSFALTKRGTTEHF